MRPRESKHVLAEWIAAAGADSRDARLQIAQTCDLDRVKAMCRSFEDFLRDLASRPA